MASWLPHWIHRGGVGLPSAFGYAVVGLGHGAEKFCAALEGSAEVRVAALVSGDAKKAAKMARRFGVPRTYSYAAFDQLADDPSVGAVYLCLPNALHAEFAERACRAGKHVLCEKPMAASAAEARRMIEVCDGAQRLLMPGYRLDFDAAHREAKRLLDTGALGRLLRVRSGFGFRAKPGWRLNQKLAGGGSLYDVGVYSVHALFALGIAFEPVAAEITRDALTGLEMATTWQGVLREGGNVECRSSYLERIPDFLDVEGERGTLRLEPAFAYRGVQLRAKFTDDAGTVQRVEVKASDISLFRLEAEELAACVRTGRALRVTGEDGLRDLEMLARIEALAG